MVGVTTLGTAGQAAQRQGCSKIVGEPLWRNLKTNVDILNMQW